jgi:hypothetical protein
MKARLIAGCVGALMLVGTMAIAQPGAAQPPPPPPPPPGGGAPSPYYTPPPTYVPPSQGRQGLVVGFSVGGGEMVNTDCDNCESLAGFAFDFSIGGMLSPQLAIVYDAFGVIRVENDAALTNATNTVAAQYWVTPIVWIKGGVGLSLVRLEFGNGFADEEYGFGVTAGAGVELIHSDTFGLDLSGRVSHGTFDGGGLSNGAVLVGFHWY